MTIAEIRGKISDTGTNLSERMEDLLTSDIFGCMRYLPPASALVPFLRTGHSLAGGILPVPDRLTNVYWSFWPWIRQVGRIPCEPDVAIGLETEDGRVHVVFIEAKYNSGLSSDEDERLEPNNQLARQLDNLHALSCATLGWGAHREIGSRALLFVTQDTGIPSDLIMRSLDEYRRKRSRDTDLYWTSWRLLPSILQLSIERAPQPEQKAVLTDMHALLLRKTLIMFTGVEPVSGRFSAPDFYVASNRSTYGWPSIPASTELSFKYEGR